MSPFVPSPARWANRDLVLYHGTLKSHVRSVLSAVDVTLGRRHTDFGRGFYTTTVEQQARSWAWQLSQQMTGSVPAVIRFEVSRDELARLECLFFIRGSFDAEDYWSFVHHCRSGALHHWEEAEKSLVRFSSRTGGSGLENTAGDSRCRSNKLSHRQGGNGFG